MSKPDVETQSQTLDEKIVRLEVEAEELEGPAREPTWDELVSNSAKYERDLEARERRRSVLPRILHAAKLKRLELEKRQHVEHAESMQQTLEAKYEIFQEHEEKLRRAKEERDTAHAEWTLTLSALQSARDRARRTEREIAELKGER